MTLFNMYSENLQTMQQGVSRETCSLRHYLGSEEQIREAPATDDASSLRRAFEQSATVSDFADFLATMADKLEAKYSIAIFELNAYLKSQWTAEGGSWQHMELAY